ncbi:hypothetical protein [Flavobacterium sp. GSA192]|uniref:hypothetical protein n=1 Tax=Flavobacterium sp. GSA192 TaxID=2576304 RepID=UPI00112B68F7|nr:hypothetical protein [Flavobacterium sp. GSA192]
MRYSIKIIGVLLVIFNYSVSRAQTQNDQLIGTWIFDFNASVFNMEEKAKAIIQKLPAVQEKLEKSYKNRQITFGVDGHYTLYLSDGRQTNGIWTFDSTATRNNTIDLITSENQIQKFIVLFISTDKLILKPQDDSNGKPMFSQWYFTKKI